MMKTLCLFFSLSWALLSIAQTTAVKNVADLTVSVTNFQGQPRQKDMVVLESVKSKQTYSCITDENGKANMQVPANDTYKIKYRDYFDTTEYKTITFPDATGAKIQATLNIQYEAAKEFVLENVYYDIAKATLRSESFKTLNMLVDLMKLKTTLVIEVQGHTDNVGSAESNLKLSQARAESVKQYLVNKGIATARIQAKGFGAEQPVASNEDETGRQQNRRTEVSIIKE